MSESRKRRLPISCELSPSAYTFRYTVAITDYLDRTGEPCRIRKIRCPRDAAPCGTCLKRGIPDSQCVFAQRPSMRSSQSYHRDVEPISPVTTNDQSSSSSTSNHPADLTDRVRRLERLLELQMNQNAQGLERREEERSPYMQPDAGEDNDPPEVDAALLSKFTEPGEPPGQLHTSTSGYVRYLPHSSRFDAFLDNSTVTGRPSRIQGQVTDVSDGPTPFGKLSKQFVEDVIDKLPPARLCAKLKNVYFDSFAPVSIKHYP